MSGGVFCLFTNARRQDRIAEKIADNKGEKIVKKQSHPPTIFRQDCQQVNREKTRGKESPRNHITCQAAKEAQL